MQRERNRAYYSPSTLTLLPALRVSTRIAPAAIQNSSRWVGHSFPFMQPMMRKLR